MLKLLGEPPPRSSLLARCQERWKHSGKCFWHWVQLCRKNASWWDFAREYFTLMFYCLVRQKLRGQVKRANTVLFKSGIQSVIQWRKALPVPQITTRQ